MFTGPVGPAEVFFYWPEDILVIFYWPGAIGPLLAPSPASYHLLGIIYKHDSSKQNLYVHTAKKYF